VCVCLSPLCCLAPQAPEPSPYIGDWWCLYDYGPDQVASWGKDYVPRFPEEVKRQVGGWAGINTCMGQRRI
jgi:hypothetical protein